VSKEIGSPIQIVCNYLAALENNTLHSKDLCFTAPCNVSSLSSDHCQRMLQDHFFKNTKSPSFTVLNIFLNFLSNQLIKFSLSQFFTVSNIKAMGADPTLRKDLLLALLQVSDEFSHRSAGIAQSLQVHLVHIMYNLILFRHYSSVQ
jgi:hypothetical protein